MDSGLSINSLKSAVYLIFELKKQQPLAVAFV